MQHVAAFLSLMCRVMRVDQGGQLGVCLARPGWGGTGGCKGRCKEAQTAGFGRGWVWGKRKSESRRTLAAALGDLEGC